MKKSSPVRLPADFPDILRETGVAKTRHDECWGALTRRYRLGHQPLDMLSWRRLARGLLADLVPAFRVKSSAAAAAKFQRWSDEMDEFAAHLRGRHTIAGMPSDFTPIAQALLVVAVRDFLGTKNAAFHHLVTPAGRRKLPARYREITDWNSLKTKYNQIPKAIREKPDALLAAPRR